MWSEKGGLTYVNDYIENLPGMPIGGIGTSTLEVGRNGAFQNNRLQNAWTMPLPYKPNGVAPGSWLALFSAPENGRGEGRLLQVGGLANLKGVAGISYTGCFPFVRLVYQEPSWPLKVKLEAFSPFVPHVAEDSALPIAFLTLEVENPTSLSMTAVMAMSWVNDIAAEYYFRGWVPQGNYNQIVKVNGTPAILMATRDPTLTGAAYLLAGQADGVVQWQAVANWLPPPTQREKARNIMVEGDGLPEIAKEQLSMWRIFLEKGDLPPDQQCEDGLMEFSSHCPIGALASTVIIPPREQRAVTFILSWFFPHHYDRPTRSGGFLGHHYAVRFPRGVMEVTGKTLPRYQELYQRSYAWRELFVETTLPAPVRDLILETLYLLPRITWWTAEDAFYILESVDCPRVSCSILNRYYVAVLSALFPDLYTRLLRATAEAQLPSGEIPSTLGVGSVRRHEYRIFNPGDVAIFPLAIYWQALWCGDRAFIAEFYPSLKRTLQWGATILDEDGDGVPDVHGIDQGWDTFPMYGCAAYIADQWLAALRAGAAMARLCHDQSFAAWCDEIFERASKTVEEKLWNGKYYDLSWQSATQMRSSICFTDQFTYGTVPAQLLGLGDIHPRERVQRALAAIWELNVRGAQFVCRAGSNPDGTPADCSYHAEQRGGASQSNCFSPVMVVPLACAALQYGQVKEGEQLLIDMAQRIIATMREPWSGKLLFDSRDGKWFYGIHYSDCLIIWEVLYAVLGLTLNVIERRLQFCPPAVPVRAPIFSRIFTGEVGISAARIELRNREEEPSYLRSITVTLPQGPRICFENVIIMPGSRWEMPLEV